MDTTVECRDQGKIVSGSPNDFGDAGGMAERYSLIGQCRAPGNDMPILRVRATLEIKCVKCTHLAIFTLLQIGDSKRAERAYGN